MLHLTKEHIMIPFPVHFEELETLYSATLGADSHSVAITSADKGEGVSMIAYALARRAAEAGRRTLLVDLNTANPTVASRLGLEGEDWSPDGAADLQGVIDLPGIQMSILSAPVATAHILNIREDGKLRAAIAAWRKVFDCIIIDTSPLTRSNQRNVSPDMVAACSDCAIFVVLAGRTAETKVSEAIARLRTSGTNIVGTIINDRYNPSLCNELCRETYRLEKRLPKLMGRLRSFFRRNAFLMQKI